MYTCVLDIGHGGRDSGAVGKNTLEKNNNLTLGLKIGKILQNHNVTVNYTRDTDKDFCNNPYDINTDLTNRIIIAKGYSPNVFVSLHNNSFNKQAKGIECHCYKFGGTDQKLATSVQNNMVSALNMMTNRGTKASNFYVLRKFDGTNTDACLVEYGFIDSEEDVILANMDIASVAISKGILEHLGIKYLQPQQIPIPTTPSIPSTQSQGGTKMKNLVIYKSQPDFYAASILSNYLHCPIAQIEDQFSLDMFSQIENVYQVGGVAIDSRIKLVSGKDRYFTVVEVLRHIGLIQ